MKYCSHCGNQVHDDAVICLKCGCSVDYQLQKINSPNEIIKNLSQRLNSNGIIFLIIGILQIIPSFYLFSLIFIASSIGRWSIIPIFLLPMAISNIISAVRSFGLSRWILKKPIRIAKSILPLSLHLALMTANLFFGGIIPAIGGIHYLASVRRYVILNEDEFTRIEQNWIMMKTSK